MNSVNRFRLQILRDEICECWRNFQQNVGNVFGRHKNRINPAAGEIVQQTEGRIWVQLGKKGHKICVTHLHPANPAVAKKLQDHITNSPNHTEDDPYGLHGNPIILPESDNISVSSIEDYWFNHWQGPPISPNNNQNRVPPQMRRSLRKSRRKSLCGICHKKVPNRLNEQNNTPSFCESQDILAHIPTVKPEIILPLDHNDKMDEDNTSRASEDPSVMTVVNRVIDHEIRTSFNLFANESISLDVLDTSLSNSKDHTDNLLVVRPKAKLGESRSCPCTPKLPRPVSKTDRQRYSMSSSLLAIPRQNSSFKSERRFDLRKSDSSPCCPNSRRSSLISTQRMSSSKSDEKIDTSSNEESIECDSKQINLRLSKMSMTYKSGVIISEELKLDPHFESTRNDLPDVIQLPNKQSGFVNLGFDGHEESSDFTEAQVTNCVNLDLDQAHAVSIGHSANGKQYGISVEPETGVFSQGEEMCNSDLEKLNEQRNKETGTDEVQNTDINKEPEAYVPSYDAAGFWEKCRQSIYWWRKPKTNNMGGDYCEDELECMAEQKPLIFFIHGVGTSSDIWTQQMWYFLACGYEVVAPDLFGHGLSSAPDDPKYYTFARMLDYIGLAFDLFVPHGRKCVVVGHNYGSSLAVAFARGRQFCVSLAVLIACGGPNPLVPYPNDHSVLNSKTVQFLNPFISCGCLSRELLYTVRGKHYEPSKNSVPSAPKYVIDHITKGQVWPEGDMPFHRRITVPTLLLYGMKDSNFTLVEMCEMEKTIPRAFLEFVPGASHDLPTETPQYVCHSIHKFIKRWKHHLS